MKRSIISILFCFISVVLCAQNISVEKFKLDENDHTASDEETMQTDQNDEACAVIKIITNEKGFSYDVGSLGVTDVDSLHEGQIWLYVPRGVKRITLRHQDYGTCEYDIPIVIESEKTYRMSLNIGGVATEKDSERLTFSCSPTNAKVFIDDIGIELKNGVYEETLGIGVHSYSVEAPNYISQEGTFELKANSPLNFVVTLNKLQDESHSGSSTIDWAAQKTTEYLVPGTEVKFKMIPVQPTDFVMGSSYEQTSYFEDELPSHSCHVDGFFIAETEVTQELWQAVMGNNPARFQGKEFPVEQVSWNDCQMFISRLNAIIGQKFRLPTEAEWECAARETKSSSFIYSGSGKVGDLCWYAGNSQRTTHTIATKAPNSLGIYDMSGNVSEWCQDWFENYTAAYEDNPKGPNSGTHKVCRGGNWLEPAWNCRVSSREMNTVDVKSSTIGLRLAM